MLCQTDLLASERSLSFSPGMRYFDYAEYGDDGSFLDGETGPVIGLALSYCFPLPGKGKATIDAGIYSGEVLYDGQTQGGIPAVTTTDQSFYSLGFGYEVPLISPKEGLTAFASLHYEKWERDILPTSITNELFEVYEWWEMSLGLDVVLYKDKTEKLNLYTRIFDIANPVMTVHLNGYGTPDLELGGKGGGEIGIRWMQRLSARRELGLSIGHKAWSFGRSDIKLVFPNNGGSAQLIHEPRSQTSTTTVRLIFLYHL
jgi:hypothetical protein